MHYYIDVVKKYAVFNGRTSRKKYWMFILYNAIFAVVAAILDTIFHTPTIGEDSGTINSLYTFAVITPSIAVGVRRLHDINKSGWWMLLPLVGLPFFLLMFVHIVLGSFLGTLGVFGGMITVIIFYMKKGMPTENKYGPSPKD